MSILNPSFWSNMKAKNEPIVSVENYTAIINNKRNPPKRGTLQRIEAYKRIPRFRSVGNTIGYAVASIGWRAGYFKSPASIKALLPPKEYSALGGSLEEIRNRKAMIAHAKKVGEFKELEWHPILDLLYNGNYHHTGFDVRKLTQIHLDIVGEAFQYIQGWDTKPIALWPISPASVTETSRIDNPYYRISNFQDEIPNDAIIWYKDIDASEPYGRGSGIGESLSDELDTSEYVANMIKSTFYNEGRPTGIVSLEAKGMTETMAERYQEEWNQEFRGPAKYNRIKFTNAKLDWTQIDQEFGSLQTLPLREELRDLFQQVYGVPPEMVGIVENSNRATIESAQYIMATNVVIPRLERLRNMWIKFLVPLFNDQRLVLDYNDPTPDNDDYVKDLMSNHPYAFKVDEIREQAGREPLGGDSGEERYTAINMVPVDSPMHQQATALVGEKQKLALQPAEKKSLVAKGVDQASLNAVVESLEPVYLTDPTVPVITDDLEKWGNKVLLKTGTRIDAAFNMLNPRVLTYIDNYVGDQIKKINDYTKETLRASLKEGVQAGEGLPGLRGRVHDAFLEGDMDIYKVRTERIARTEVNSASNFGTLEAGKQSGVIDMKQWAPALVNTRRTHEESKLISQPIPIDGKFIVGGWPADHPGDPNLPPKELVNCQCALKLVASESKAWTPQKLKAFLDDHIKDMEPWVKSLRAAFIKGFERQLEEALDTFDREVAG